jgi:hypothetical protein
MNCADDGLLLEVKRNRINGQAGTHQTLQACLKGKNHRVMLSIYRG